MTRTMFMALMLAALLSVTEAAIPRDQCQLFCTAIGFPVCGSDGRTYGNPCELRAGNCLKSPYLQVTLVRNGSCYATPTYQPIAPYYTPRECSLICTEEYKPVCGSDGNTYGNACQVRVRNCQGSAYDQITIVSNRTCGTKTTTTTTPTTIYRTVYLTRYCPDVCTAIANPVCGSDGKIYGNPCLLAIENCKRSPKDQIVVVSYEKCAKTSKTTTPSTYR